MPYDFAPGVSGCVADGQLVLLDVTADRYRMLPQAAETALLRHFHGEARQGRDDLELARLRDAGVFQDCPDGAVRGLCRQPLPNASFFDEPWRSPGTTAVAGAGLAVVRAIASLRLRSLAGTLERLPNANRRSPAAPSDLRRHAAAFAELRLVLRTLDRCLPLSIALARTVRRNHGDVRLVIGVKLEPFAAHAWVQAGDVVLNDRLDAVTPFTPILVK